jgi:NhaP-type Na+/H+ or K+/H+ antiporter
VAWVIPTIAVAVLGYVAVSRRLEGTPITAAMVFTAAGLLVGSKTFRLVDLDPAREAVKLLAEATLGAVLFSDAARIDLRALRDEFRLPARLLGIGLPLTIAAGFLASLVLFGSLGWSEALVLAVVLAPTDAALGQAVVTLPSIPSAVRQGLNVESGLNDGLCVPVFFTTLAIASTQAGFETDSHAVRLVVEEVGYGVLFGVLGGVVSAAVVVLAYPHRLVDRSWLQVVPLAGATLCFTTAAAVGGSGFVAAFVGGMVFGGIRRRVGGEVGYLIEEVGGLLGAATFVVFGAVLLEPALDDLSWAIAGYAVLSLTVVRMVPVAIAMIGTRARPRTVAFLGWFGPRGLASIVFAILIIEAEGELPHESLLITTVFVTVGLSVLIHGLSAAPLARRYAAWHEAHRTEEEPPRLEAAEVPATRWRFPSPSEPA